MEPENIQHFATSADFARWLKKHHAKAEVLWLGYHKRATGTPSITWPESVDEALCFGWIDGLRKRIDDERYVIRFTPRKTGSTWSAVNVHRMEALVALGRVQKAGLLAYEARSSDRTAIYAYEQRSPELEDQYEKLFRKNQKAWAFYQAQAPSYRKSANWWVVSAKQESTRTRRLTQLIADSAAGRRLAQYDWNQRPKQGDS